MDWCGSSTPKTSKYRTINKERHSKKNILLNDCEAPLLDRRSGKRKKKELIKL